MLIPAWVFLLVTAIISKIVVLKIVVTNRVEPRCSTD